MIPKYSLPYRFFFELYLLCLVMICCYILIAMLLVDNYRIEELSRIARI